MKTSTASASTTRSKDQSERQTFLERAYLALLSSFLSQFEIRTRDGDLQLAYDHSALAEKECQANEAFQRDNERLSGKSREIALQRHIDQSDDLSAQVRDEDEEWRMDLIVRRCYAMAKISTDVYFEESDFASKC